MKKVSSGQPLSILAADHNAFIDAAMDYQARALEQRVEPKCWASGIVLVRNDTGSDQDRFAVLAISAPLILPTENMTAFSNMIAFKGIVPAAGHKAKFVITATPLADGAIGPATVHGPTHAKIDVGSGEEGWDFADVYATRTDVLKTIQFNAGAMILWRDGGLGEQWATVRLSNIYSTFA